MAETMLVTEELNQNEVPMKGAKAAIKSLLMNAQAPKSGPVVATANIPIALVVTMLLLRAFWYYREHKTKLAAGSSEETTAMNRERDVHVQEELPMETSNRGMDTTVDTMGTSVSSSAGKHTASNTLANEEFDTAASRAAALLKANLEREAQAKQQLAAENLALQNALDSHKSTVDKFQSELNARNDRLSAFENEQDTVRRDLGAQIEVLKKELQERQKHEQGNLTSKENLCNDLISKIQTLNADLENHEKLWQGVAQKAKKKETESATKVETLQEQLHQEQVQRAKELALREDEYAELAAKVKGLASQKEKQGSQQSSYKFVSQGSKSTEAELKQKLAEEQKHTTKLNSKLEMFTAELASRQGKVTILNTKMADFERLSRTELKTLQRELDAQVQQRSKLEKAAQEMTRILQERRDQCVRLSTELDSSKAELEAVENRVTVLTSEVGKRDKLATSRLEAMQEQLDEERQQCSDCQETVTNTGNELIKKQEEFVQLTARMDLFLKELQFREEQVASLETKLTTMEDLATSDIKALQARLQEQQKGRDTWNKSTNDVIQLLQDKKAQVVGLTTRFDLFERELEGRKENVALLQTKVQEREDAEAVKMEPYRTELQRLQKERDHWKAKTAEINAILRGKMAQTEGLKTRLHLFRVELSQKGEHVDLLEKTVRGKKQKTEADMAPARQKLDVQREQRDAWTTKTEDINRQLNEKRSQCVGLNTRALLFKQELETKEKHVATLGEKVANREFVGGGAIETLKKQLIVQTMARDEWRMSTKKVVQLLAERKKEAVDLTAQVKERVSDLQNCQQRRATLESKIKERKAVSLEKKPTLDKELKLVEEHRDDWKKKTESLTMSLKDTEQSIVGLETRVMLFEQELEKRTDTVEKLEKSYVAIEEKYTAKRKVLLEELTVRQKEREDGVEATLMLNRTLKATKRECIGLTTRAKLFRTELDKRADLVSDQKAKIKETENAASARLSRFRTALLEKTKERDEWKGKTEGIAILCKQTKEEVVGLGTRLELFMVQVMEHEENVSRAEARLNKKPKNKSFAKELEAAKEKRDDWTTKAIDIERALKDKKDQIPGLQTRRTLFGAELSKLDNQVAELQKKLSDKENALAAKISPLKEALEVYLQQRNDWHTQVEKIDHMLSKKQEQCLPVAGRLETCIDELTSCEERIVTLEKELKDEVEADEFQRARSSFESHQKELRQWEDSTSKVKQLLHEKQLGTDGLKTRMIVFGGELQKREESVMRVQAKIEDHEKALASEISSLKDQIEVEHQEHDKIIEATLAGNEALKKMEDTCNAVEARRGLFEEELRQRENRVTLLAAKLQEKEFDFNAHMKTLKHQLAINRVDRDKWKDSTESIENLLQETKAECVGLATRSQLFMAEKEDYDSQVAELEGQVKCKDSEFAETMAPLQSKLQELTGDRNDWNKKTTEIDSQLNGAKREVVGLYTRSKLFSKELALKEEGVASVQASIRIKDEAFAERMGPLMQEYKTHKDDLDAWEKSTLNVEKMLEKTENECASIPTRLDLFRREQKTREQAVAELDAKIKNKEDLVAIQLGFLLNELKLQQKHRSKWKKVTIEMHRSLKETKDRVATLTKELETAKLDLKEREERIVGLETALRDGRDMVAQQMKALRNELQLQKEKRDSVSQSCTTLLRHLEVTKKQCAALSQKLEESGSQLQNCTAGIEKIEAKVAEKHQLDAAQIDSIKEQLKVHLEQQDEWEHNTKQMKQQLKEKQTLCATAKTKLALLGKLQRGEEICSSLATDAGESQASPKGFSTLGSLGISNRLATMGNPEDCMNPKRGSLSTQQNDTAEQLERELKEKENLQLNLNSKLEVLSSELMNL